MPEGHTVHRLARTFATLFDGQVLRVSSPQGRFADGAAVLDGRRLVASEAWGKQLFLGFAGADRSAAGPSAAGPDTLWLRTHLGLYGAWTFAGAPDAPEVAHAIGAPRRRIGERDSIPSVPGPQVARVTSASDTWEVPAPRGQVRVRLLGDHAVADLTGPTACEVVTPEEKRAVEARLGPDPIRDDGDPAAFVAAVGRSRVTIGQQLMDQAVVAGVGNIYRAEVLFRAGVDPLRPGRDVPAATVREIWDDLVVLMRDGADHGAIVTTRPEHRTPVSPDGAPAPGRTRQNTDGTPGSVPSDQAFYVYHRDGLPCRVCGTPVLVKELAGRNLFWCPTCQP
ncbi:Fpg/Nei family DNA glycosylase [Promicromonospora thailandica]|uniref:DNA-(apurinic or apyrimidinic site) lyase n=1 Tax=Promicromonospora thailandica TaxID=765201 RepID=A0A9X2G6K2_9MICO|nr:zinc finger domain-containing protein [Promicromonospora thailandica]MCP2262836.1 endonuclease-8 [Promicromonospora thailandica]BFF18170.1 formamidopyrimidine-DNA glycosylase [Promicromonospora thailandica]